MRYILPDGNEIVADAKPGTTVMEVGVKNGVTGIVAECGGNAMCATCHVYVSSDYVDRLPPCESDEDEMLECTASDRTENSRLSCQLVVSDQLDDLEVTVPGTQV